MHRPYPPLHFIRSFECAARHLSFSRAAEELGYTQAAISSHVRALEQYVGRALFVRNARSLQLTEIGEAFLPNLRQAIAQIDSATDAVVARAQDRSIIVACPMSLAENWMPACLAGFLAANPGVEVAVHGTVWHDPEDHVSDIVISVSREDEMPPGSEPLWPETLSLLCAPSLLGRLRRPSDLAALPKITPASRQECWPLLGAALGGVDLAGGPALRTNASNIALELAAHGIGLTVVLTSLARIYLDRGLLAEPFPVRPPSPWTYCISGARGRRGATVNRLRAHIMGWEAPPAALAAGAPGAVGA